MIFCYKLAHMLRNCVVVQCPRVSLGYFKNTYKLLNLRVRALKMSATCMSHIFQCKSNVFTWHFKDFYVRWFTWYLPRKSPYIKNLKICNLSSCENQELLNLTCLSLVRHMRQWTGSALFQVMACRLFGAKPLPEPMLVYCQLDSWEKNSVKLESEFYHVHSRKCIRNRYEMIPKFVARSFCATWAMVQSLQQWQCDISSYVKRIC